MFYGRLIKLVFPTRVERDRTAGRWITAVVSTLLNLEETDVRAECNQHGGHTEDERLPSRECNTHRPSLQEQSGKNEVFPFWIH